MRDRNVARLLESAREARPVHQATPLRIPVGDEHIATDHPTTSVTTITIERAAPPNRARIQSAASTTLNKRLPQRPSADCCPYLAKQRIAPGLRTEGAKE